MNPAQQTARDAADRTATSLGWSGIDDPKMPGAIHDSLMELHHQPGTQPSANGGSPAVNGHAASPGGATGHPALASPGADNASNGNGTSPSPDTPGGSARNGRAVPRAPASAASGSPAASPPQGTGTAPAASGATSSPAGSGGAPSSNGGSTVTTPSGSMEAPNIDAARGVARQQAQSLQSAAGAGEQYTNDLLAGGLGKDTATMSAAQHAQELTAQAAAAWAQVNDGLNAHSQGEEYHNTGMDANAEFLRH